MQVDRGIRIFLKFGLASILLVIIALVVIPIAFKDQILQKAITQINDQINAELKVNGAVELSFFNHFPNLSLSFNQVELLGAEGQAFIDAKELGFYLNPFQLLDEEPKLNEIYIADALITITHDEDGKGNYDILKKNEQEAAARLTVEKLEIRNSKLEVNLKDEVLQFMLDVSHLDAKLSLEGNHLNIDLSTASFLHSLLLENSFRAQDEYIDLACRIISHDDTIKIEQGKLSAFGADIGLNLLKIAKQETLDLSVAGKKIKQLIKLFPAVYKQSFKDIDGTADYNAKLTWKRNEQHSELMADLQLLNLDAFAKQYPFKLKAHRLDLQFKQHDEEHEYHITTNNARLNGNKIDFDLEVKENQRKHLSLTLDGLFDLDALNSLISQERLKNITGQIQFKDFELKGYKDQLLSVEDPLNVKGKVSVPNASLNYDGIRYKLLETQLNLSKSVIEAKSFNLQFCDSKLTFSGVLNNLDQYLYSLITPNEERMLLKPKGNIHIRRLNIAEMVKQFSSREVSSNDASKSSLNAVFWMVGNASIQIDELLYEKLLIKNFQAKARFLPAKIRFNELSLMGFDGETSGYGDLLFKSDKSIELRANIHGKQLSLSEIFRQLDNFGQNTLTADYIDADIEINGYFDARWMNYTHFDQDHFISQFTARAKNGKLTKFEPMKKLSRYIKLEELMDIEFAELNNEISITNRWITIPNMEIKNSAMNLNLSGRHSFDNDIDYGITVSLREALSKKFRLRQKAFENYEETPNEGIKLFVKMNGTVDEPVITYNKEKVTKRIGEDIKKEIKNFGQLFEKYENSNRSIQFETSDTMEFVDW